MLVISGGRVQQRMGSASLEKSQYELLRDKRVAEVEKKFGPVLAARKELSVLTSPSLLFLQMCVLLPFHALRSRCN